MNDMEENGAPASSGKALASMICGIVSLVGSSADPLVRASPADTTHSRHQPIVSHNALPNATADDADATDDVIPTTGKLLTPAPNWLLPMPLFDFKSPVSSAPVPAPWFTSMYAAPSRNLQIGRLRC